MFESFNEIVIIGDIPGVKKHVTISITCFDLKKDIFIQTNGKFLYISGEKFNSIRKRPEFVCNFLERDQGTFTRKFLLHVSFKPRFCLLFRLFQKVFMLNFMTEFSQL